MDHFNKGQRIDAYVMLDEATLGTWVEAIYEAPEGRCHRVRYRDFLILVRRVREIREGSPTVPATPTSKRLQLVVDNTTPKKAAELDRVARMACKYVDYVSGHDCCYCQAPARSGPTLPSAEADDPYRMVPLCSACHIDLRERSRLGGLSPSETGLMLMRTQIEMLIVWIKSGQAANGRA